MPASTNRLYPLVLTGILLLAGGCTPYSGAGESPKARETRQLDALSAAGEDEGLICKREKVVGSRLGKKVCTTQAQRDEKARQGKATAENVQRASKASGPRS